MSDLRDVRSYREALRQFRWEALWALVDGDRARLNLAHECVDRHVGRGTALRLQFADGRREEHSFRDLADWSSRFASFLESEGVAAGDRVAIMLEPSLAFYGALFGTVKRGAVAVPLFTLFGPDGLRLRVGDCAPRLLLVGVDAPRWQAQVPGVRVVAADEGLAARLARESARYAPATAADDLAVLQYTSGTTRALPEAVRHTHRAVVTLMVAALFGVGLRAGDRYFCPSSPAWGHGLWHGTIAPLALGIAAGAYSGRFDADRLVEAVTAFGVTNMAATPTVYRMLRRSGRLAPWLAFVLPSPQDTIRLLKRVLALDPSNERAKAGIRWARVRLGLPPEQSNTTPDVQPTSVQTNSTSTEDAPDEDTDEDSIRSLLLSEEVQQQAKKGALAHRARRTINPFLGIFVIMGTFGLIAIGLGTLLFVPPETLAAWIPAAPHYSPAGMDIPPVAQINNSTQAAEVSRQADLSSASALSSEAPKAAVKSFTSDTDTIVLSQPPPYIYQQPAETQSAALSTEANPEADSTEPAQVSIDPAQLMGPVGPFPPESQGAVDRALLVHQPAYPSEKWIEVNVTTQQVTAWEGDTPVMSFTVSTGLPNTPTLLGKFNIYWKLTSTLMVGPNYYLPEVPYTMYFYAGYSLHGTYWHHNFGQPMSHGCVNLETGDARKLFDWADPVLPPGQTEVVASANNPGTLVVVHE